MIGDWIFEIIEEQILYSNKQDRRIKIRTDTIGDMYYVHIT